MIVSFGHYDMTASGQPDKLFNMLKNKYYYSS